MVLNSKRLRHLIDKAEPKSGIGRKKLILSIVSLILVFMVLVTSTVCWFTLKTADGYANTVQLQAGKGLRVNDTGETLKNITDNSYLLPASSVDGRNLYFPADGTPFTSKTDDNMVFRSANAGDMNYNYIQLNFSLTAEADYTSIFFKKDSTISVKTNDGDSAEVKAAKKKAEKAIRAAIFYEGIENNKPIVFCSQNKSVTTRAVDEIDRTTGRFITRSKQVAVPFRDYTYGKRTLATLNRGETRRFSLLVWLEGTDEANCTSVPVMLKELELNLFFTTSWDNTEKIKFVDNTTNHSVITALENRAYSLVLNYDNKAHNIDNYRFIMYKSTEAGESNVYYCNIPGNANNDLTFHIIDDSNEGADVYRWESNLNGRSTKNRGTATAYIADTLNGTDSRGHWYDGDIEEGGYGGGSGEAGDGW